MFSSATLIDWLNLSVQWSASDSSAARSAQQRQIEQQQRRSDRQEKNRRRECGAGSRTTDARRQPGVACSYCTVKPS
jgi:hypothetical protein